jgi:hypothetical protein
MSTTRRALSRRRLGRCLTSGDLAADRR